MPASRVNIEVPFGTPFDQVHCPACGSPIMNPDIGISESPCAHVRFVYLDSIGEFAFAAKDVEAELEKAEEAAGDDDDWHPLDAARTLLDEKTGLCLDLNTGGMACGPVWDLTVFGLDLVAADEPE